MRTGLLFTLIVLCLVSAAQGVQAFDPRVKAAVVLDANAGRLLYSHNPDLPIPPASVAKVMTMYLALEAVEQGRAKFTDQVVVDEHARSMGGARMRLKVGESVSLEDLLKGMAVVSGNDAATAAAELIAGDEPTFVALMNKKARTLGMHRTTFKNANGLPAEGQYSTASDLAILTLAYFKRFPKTYWIHSLPEFSYKGRTWGNHNRLVADCPGVDGLKTGYVDESGYNVALTAERNGRRLIVVVMGGSSKGVRDADSRRLIEAAFSGELGAKRTADVRTEHPGHP